ncbi:MAG: helix-turn-helix transcriptional regulator [bacterium]
MSITLTHAQIDQLIRARKTLLLSKTVLSYKAGVSLRTINDLESKKRCSFSEATLLSLCKSLEIDYEMLLNEGALLHKETGDDESEDSKEAVEVLSDLFQQMLERFNAKSSSFLYGIFIGISLIIMLVISVAFLTNKQIATGDTDPISNQRIDWIEPRWKNAWEVQGNYYVPDSTENEALNYVHMKQMVRPGEIVAVELKWTYKFGGIYGGTPMKYVSAYTEWDPDNEIRLFAGVLDGIGHKILNFQIVCPEHPGTYRLRIFNSSSFGPVPSFFGCPPIESQMSPCNAPFIEMIVEVLSPEM